MTSFRSLVGRLGTIARTRQDHAAVGNLGVRGDRLVGYFSILGDRLAGLVDAGFFDGDASLEILVRRAPVVIASCRAWPERGDGGFRFMMPIDGRFKAAELLAESVTVVVRNKRGEAGTMRLDGAAQLELIREHLGVPCEPVIDLDFAHGGNAQPYLGAGWSSAERDFTWTEDDESTISFDAPSEPGTYALRLTSGAFLPKPNIERQDMQILVNDELVGTVAMTDAHMQYDEVRFSGDLLLAGPRVMLRFLHPDAGRPSDFYGESKDHRRLAFCVRRLSVVRLLAAAV
jgi:hypothetical protein